jgi:hypothetical protein
LNDSASYALHKQIEAARLLRDDLADLIRDDPDFLTDAIEGETDLFEAIDRLVASIQEDAALIRGIGGVMADLKARKERIESRFDMKRTLIAKAMDLAEIKKRESPAGTVSLKRVPPCAIITDESAIPSRFWKAQAPKLDRAAVSHALRDEGIEVPGATLSNGAPTIAIRT